MTENFESKAHRRTRNAYRWECTFEHFVGLLIADTFLAKLLSEMGMSDALIGVIASLTSLSYLFQLATLLVAQRIKRIKLFTTVVHTVGRLVFAALFLLPFLPFALPHKTVLVFVCVLVGYLGNYLVTSMIYKWGNSFVEPHHRARFNAGKEMLSLLTGIVVTLVIGYVMDYYEAINDIYGGFLFTAIAIAVFSLCDFVCLLLMKKGKEEKEFQNDPAVHISFGEIMRGTLGNKRFRSVIYLTVLNCSAAFVLTGFLGTYRINELAFTVGTIQLFNMLGSLARFALSKPFGAFSDKHSYARGVEFGFLIALVAFVCCAFTTPSTRFLTIAYIVLSNVSAAGTNANLINITYSYVDSRYFVQASAIKNSIGGIAGFIASLLGSKLLSYIQANGNMLFGVKVYGQQVLAMISSLLMLACVLYSHFVICRQKRIEE